VGDIRNVARAVGRYEILEELGRGGMATVYLARQVDLRRLIALKELSALRQSDPAFAHRFVRESRLAGSLSHPNIVTVHDYFEHAATPYIAMEYVEGGSLRPLIGHLSLAQIAGVLEGILAALAHAEAHRIVHRDIKPENVMVTSDGGVKITDFGIAKATGRLQTSSALTAAGSTVGTPNYMAPEQAMGHEVGHWTDLYSTGVIAFELFVGRAPFADTDEPMAVLMRQVSDPVPPAHALNPDLHRGISTWIERMLEKDPSDRPASARDAWEQFEEIVLELVGPRWRRSAPLPGSARPRDSSPPGPHTPPPTRAARPPLMPTLDVPDRPWTTMSRRPTRRLEDDPWLAPTLMPDQRARHTHPITAQRQAASSPRRHGVRHIVTVAVAVFVALFALAAALGRGGSSQQAAPPQQAAPAQPGVPTAPAAATGQPGPQAVAPAPATAPAPPTKERNDIGDSRSDDPSDDMDEP
jgi:serine/threonine protein kinase